MSADPGATPPPGDFAETRILKRELLDELRAGWEQGKPESVEELLRRWPGPTEDDAASLLFEDYCQRQQRAESQPTGEKPPDLGDYEQRFPSLKDSLRQILQQHDLLTSLGASASEAGRRLALPAVGDELFGFRLRRELGRGAFARVFLAEQAALAGRPVVLKVSAIEGDEPQTLAQLQHTHIVPIYSVHEDARAGLRAVCMPYFGGASLSAVLKTLWAESPVPASGAQLARALAACGDAGGSPPFAQFNYIQATIWIVARLADALQHAHERGIWHRDVKPSNVLLAADGQPMLLDFNLSQSQTADRARAEATLGGTVAYMAPEHLRALAARDAAQARQLDQRADIYSLGMVLFEMLAGRSPFDQSASYFPLPALIESMALERARSWPSLRRHRPDVPWGLESIARLCLAPEPAQRYQHAGHLAEDLRRLLEDRPLRYAPELSWRERGRKWARRHPRLTASSAVTAAAALLLITGANVLVGTRAKLDAAQQRAFEAEGAEAREQKKLFDEGYQRALCLVNTTTDTPDHLRRGRDECQRTLALYEVLDRDDWQQQRLYRRLAPEERGRLADEVRDLLVLLARSRTALASGPAKQKALRDALALLDRAEAIPGLPPSAALWEDRASYLDQLGEKAAARQARERARSLPPRDARDHYWHATSLALAGKYPAAIRSLDEAIRLSPRHYWSWLQRGLCYSALHRPDLALGDFTACVALWPESPWGHFNRGRCLDQLGSRAEAVAEYTAAIQRDGDFLPAYLDRGLARLQLQDHAGALEDFNRAKALGHGNAGLEASRGLALEGLGRFAEADRAFALSRQLDPHDVQARLAYAFAVHQRLPEQARAAFAEVLKHQPANPQALYGLGMLAALADRQSAEALAFFGRALEADPAFVAARRGRANVLAHRGAWNEAHREISLCLKADPSGVTLYAGACVYALLMEHSAGPERAAWCRQRALDLLEQALRAGYGAERLREDDDLAALHGLPRFERLAAGKKLH
jgi:serine/threonine protein kinase/lipoprotein NlpI